MKLFLKLCLCYTILCCSKNDSFWNLERKDSFTPPIEECSITETTSSDATRILNLNYKYYFIAGEQLAVTISTSTGNDSNWQIDNMSLFLNESLIHDYGNWLVFTDGETREFWLPYSAVTSNCYTLRVSKVPSCLFQTHSPLFSRCSVI